MAYTDIDAVKSVERRLVNLLDEVQDKEVDGIKILRDQIPGIRSDLTRIFQNDIAARRRAAEGNNIIPINHPAWHRPNDAEGLADALSIVTNLISSSQDKNGYQYTADVPSSLGWLLRITQMLEQIEDKNEESEQNVE